ncbi:MAG: HAMP domain-containing protein, partial [Planctomycetota bacterium]
MEAAYEARIENVESYARTLVSEGRADRAFLILEGAAQECTDDIVGVDLAIATGISDGSDARNFAFQIWTAAGWPVGEACTVQVCDLKGDVLSSFDYDSPPEGWLPAPPRAGETEGFRTLRGRGKGAYIRFYVWDLPLKLGGVGVPGGVSVRGIARFAVPDRWDMLLANLRPAIFAEPLGGLASTGSELLLLANLNPDGTARRTGLQGGTLQGIDEELLERARRKGSASARMVHEDEPARVYVVPVAEGYAALVVADSRLRRATLALSKVLLIDAAVFGLFLLGLILFSGGPPSFLFAHRVALVLVLLSVPPVLLLAAYNTRVATERHEDEIRARLRWRLDLAATLLANTPRLEDVNDDWCATFAADYRADLNIYVDEELKATSRPGVWDTGLLADRLDAQAHVALNLRGRKAYDGPEPFGAGGRLFVSYRRIQGRWDGEVLVAAPALDDRIGLERRETGANALLLAAFMLTAMVIIFVALFLARTLTAPLERLRDATQRVAAGDFDAALPERRRDEFGELLRAFNSMTREIHDAQDLRVRAEKQAAWREMAKQIAHEIKNPL